MEHQLELLDDSRPQKTPELEAKMTSFDLPKDVIVVDLKTLVQKDLTVKKFYQLDAPSPS